MSDEKRPAESKDKPSESKAKAVPKKTRLQDIKIPPGTTTKKMFFGVGTSADVIAKALIEGGADKK